MEPGQVGIVATGIILIITVLLAIIGWMGRVMYNDMAEDVRKLKKDLDYLYATLRAPQDPDNRRRKL